MAVLQRRLKLVGTDVPNATLAGSLVAEQIVLAIAERIKEVRDLDVQVGYLHRGFEKECESGSWYQCIPYTDRLNYNSAILANQNSNGLLKTALQKLRQ